MSKLALYASDPDRYWREGDRIRNPKAVVVGERGHERRVDGRSSSGLAIALLAGALAAGAIVYWALL